MEPARRSFPCRSLVNFAFGLLEETERFLISAWAALDQRPELVERFTRVGEAAQLLAGQSTNSQGNGRNLRRGASGLSSRRERAWSASSGRPAR